MIKIGRVVVRKARYPKRRCGRELASFQNGLVRSGQELEPAAGTAIPVAVVCTGMMIHVLRDGFLCGEQAMSGHRALNFFSVYAGRMLLRQQLPCDMVLARRPAP
jgi:hypothetical protein